MPTNELGLDRFEKAREAIWNLPGFDHCQSTISAPGSAFFPGATWVIHTIFTDEHRMIFLEKIDKEGGTRIVLPDNVTKRLYDQYETLVARRRSKRAQHGAHTRKAKGIKPFEKKEDIENAETEENSGNH